MLRLQEVYSQEGEWRRPRATQGQAPAPPYATIYPHGWRPFVYLEQKHPSFLRNMYYVCSYAASIGRELTGGSVINSMIKIRKGIPYYPKIAHRLSESVLGDVLSTLQIYRNQLESLLYLSRKQDLSRRSIGESSPAYCAPDKNIRLRYLIEHCNYGGNVGTFRLSRGMHSVIARHTNPHDNHVTQKNTSRVQHIQHFSGHLISWVSLPTM